MFSVKQSLWGKDLGQWQASHMATVEIWPQVSSITQGESVINFKWHVFSSLAVDGKENINLPNCAIMDNYYVDKPVGSLIVAVHQLTDINVQVFMVDLGAKTEVSGVVILTWQGAGQGTWFYI